MPTQKAGVAMADKTVDVTRPRPVDDVIEEICRSNWPDAKRNLCLELVQAVRWEMAAEIEAKFSAEN